MRQALGLLALAASFFLLATAFPASAATPIPGTNVQVVELGPVTKSVNLGTTVNFTWAVFNGGPATYSLAVTANASDPGFSIAVFPSSFAIPRDTLREVTVNVTTPEQGTTRTVTIHVRFETQAPVASFVDRDATLVARATPASVGFLTAFAAAGAIIVIGFTATLVFERTRVPDLLVLILLGLLLGPVAVTYFGVSFVPPGVLEVVTPYFTALALMIILFDGGLNLRLGEIVKGLGVIGLHTGVAFVLTTGAVALVTNIFLGYPLLVGLLLGAILGGTSSDVVLGIVRKLRASDETKILLSLEAVITDILSVVTVLALIEYLRGGAGASPSIVLTELGQAFLVALGFALFAGLGWLVLLRKLEDKSFSFMLTIAVLFLLYAATEFTGGSGAMAAFIFGLILGNHRTFEDRFRLRIRFVIDERIKQFHSEVSFVIRTFFFVLLGIAFTLEFSGAWAVSTTLPVLDATNGTFTLFLLGVVLIFLAIVGSRALTARLTAAVRPKPPGERRLLWALIGRGFTVAVLASFPFSLSAFTSPQSPGDLYYSAVMLPYETQFLNIAFFMILLTVGATTIGVVTAERMIERDSPRHPEPKVDPAVLAVLNRMDLTELEVHETPPRRRR